MSTDESIVLYETPHIPRARRVAVALLFGALPPIVGAWWRWVRQRGEGPTPAHLVLGAAVAGLMIAAALRSRTVFRVELTATTLSVHRDPGVVERFPLDEITARAEPTVGGWSRSPSERLVLATARGETVRYTLPDDAHSPGIVDDITRAQRGTPLAQLLEVLNEQEALSQDVP